MPLPALAPIAKALLPIAINAGASFVGHKLLGDGPDTPDFSGMVGEQFDLQRAMLDQMMGRRMSEMDGSLRERSDGLEEDLAALGVTGSGGVSAMDALYGRNNEARRDLGGIYGDALLGLSAEEAAAISGAEMDEAMIGFERDMMSKQRQYEALGSLLGGANTAFTLHQLTSGGGQNAGAIVDDFSGAGQGVYSAFDDPEAVIALMSKLALR